MCKESRLQKSSSSRLSGHQLSWQQLLEVFATMIATLSGTALVLAVRLGFSLAEQLLFWSVVIPLALVAMLGFGLAWRH